ncbi:uncharacterized protein CXorf66 homolog [Bos indicus]|uniref:Uncharacterized protein CXorf66 homolog n=1 Tax=Bos indicus TaxID=9915 RepID=A0ABM4S141_BOSIN|nr:uncharacterized protein CXorf66 homolog [Bos indicus x Bos taurus]
MNLFIYVLLLSIWTSSCLDRNESNGSATAVSTHAESKQGRMQGIRQYLLIVLTVILIIGFVIRCYFFIQYICVGEESHRAIMVKEEGITEASSTSSKISFTDSKSLTAGPGNPEKQSVLSSIDNSSRPSSRQKASVPLRAKKLVRPSSQKNPSKSSTHKTELGSLPQKKLHRTHSPKKAHRGAHAHKHIRSSQVSPSYPKKAITPTWPSSLQCLVKPTKTSPPYAKSQSVPEQSNVVKLTKLRRHRKPKSPASEGSAEILSRPQPVNFCQCYKEICLVCSASSEPFITHISERNMKHVLVPDFSRELKHSYKSFHKTEPKDNALYGSMNDSHFTCNSDDESDKEATIMCNIKCKETIYKTSQNNLRPHGKKKKRTTYVEEANF